MVTRCTIVMAISSISENGAGAVAATAPDLHTMLFVLLLALLITVLVLLICKRKKESKAGASRKTEPIAEVSAEKEETVPDSYLVGKLHKIGKRTSQQDSFAVSDENDENLCKERGLIAIVADGMGGLADGDKISSLVTLSFFRGFHENPATDNPGDMLLNMLKNANSEVNLFLKNKTEQCGSTLVTGIVKEGKLSWLTVGDSHIYLYRGASLLLLNREHIYESDLDVQVINGEISAEEAVRDTQKGALTSYIGMGKLEKVDRSRTPVSLQKGDRLLFATDGIFGTVKEEQLAKIMMHPIQESIQLLDEWICAVDKKNQDNYTAVIIECR